MAGDLRAVAPAGRLRPGDRVRLVSPASPASPARVEQQKRVLEGLGLAVEYGAHVFDVGPRLDFLAGTDADRASDLNAALRDPGVRAVFATRGGKGAYRIADRLDVDAARRNRPLLAGFSEITILHLVLLKDAGLPGLHGAVWDAETFGMASAASFVRAVTDPGPVVVQATDREPTSGVTTCGRAAGRLIGGNQDMVATAAGWALPDLDGAILLLEAVGLRLGHIDRQLTMLARTGVLDGVAGVAVGQYTGCGQTGDPTADPAVRCTEIDVLRDWLTRLGVPVLGGLPIGHGPGPVAVPIGTHAVLDAGAGTLTVDAAVT